MVVICLLLLCAAGGLLLTGIVRDSDVMVGSSIGVSLVVALLLLAGLRGSKTGETAGEPGTDTADRPGRPRTDRARTDTGRGDDLPTQILAGRAGQAADRATQPSAQAAAQAKLSAPARGKVSAPQLAGEPGRRDDAATEVIGAPSDETIVTGAADEDTDDEEYPDPPDEPAIEPVLPGERDRMAGLDDEVAVVDGRPRYHLTDCPHLEGKDAEPLLASEAVELGFTPCVRCRPVSALLGKDVGSSH